MTEVRIVVIGAGVAGLTTALLLSRNQTYNITVAAKHMPGDYDIEYASPWAGANYLPVSEVGTEAAMWDRDTWPELEMLARLHPESGVHFQELVLYELTKDENPLRAELWFKDVLPNYRVIPEDQLGSGVANGFMCTTVCINTSLYLPWLVSQCLKAGVVFKRGVFGHILEAVNVHHCDNPAELIVNCTGLSAGNLGGVEDKNMIPVRGQTVLVRNDPGAMFCIEKTSVEPTYIMQRAAGGGTLLGGCYQHGSSDPHVDHNLAQRIMERSIALCPALTGGKGIEHLSIIRHSVGLRPLRLSGTRIEKEKMEGVVTVHNYGHGGFGYQSSYGCAQAVVKLVEEALKVG